MNPYLILGGVKGVFLLYQLRINWEKKRVQRTYIYIISGNFAGELLIKPFCTKAKYIKKPIEQDIERDRYMIWPPLGIPPVAKSWPSSDTFYEQLSPIDVILLRPNINTMPLYWELFNSHLFTSENSLVVAKKLGILFLGWKNKSQKVHKILHRGLMRSCM